MKKILSLALCVMMIFSLTAAFTSCGETEKDGKVAYVLAEKGDTYSLGLASNFKTAFEAKGGKVVMEQFAKGTADFSDYLQTALNKKADVIFAPNSIEVAAKLIPQAATIGITCPILAGDTWEHADILSAVKGTNNAVDVYLSTFFDEGDANEVATAFVTGFKAWLNSNAEAKTMNGGNDIVAAVSALGFDAYNVAMAAIRKAAETKGEDLTSVDVATALWATDLVGVTGSVKFDEKGDAIKDSAYIKKAGDGKFDFEKKQTVENTQTVGTAKTYDKAGVALNKTTHEITIGIYEPTSGANGNGGKQEVLGIQYANSLDNKIVIGEVEYTVKLTVADNQSDDTACKTAAATLVSANSLVVLGSYGSGVSIAAAPTFEEAGIPAIGISCTNAAVTDGNDYYFRTCFLDPFQGSVMADFAWSLIK